MEMNGGFLVTKIKQLWRPDFREDSQRKEY